MHNAILEGLQAAYFRDRTDLAARFPEYFNPLPLPAIAFVLNTASLQTIAVTISLLILVSIV
jgi:hypothetical protein